MYNRIAKKKKPSHVSDPSVGERDTAYRRRLIAGAGVGATPDVDPVYRLIGQFSREFDAVGKRRAAQMGQPETPARETTGGASEQAPEQQDPESRERLSAAELRRRYDSPVYSHSARELAEGDFSARFSSHAFNYGTLAASVMAGKGKEMFTTCCRRAGTYAPEGSQDEKKIRSAKSMSAKVRNQPASLVFDEKVHAAVGITVDSIRSASRIFEVFRQVVNDDRPHSDNRLRQYGVETMEELYPFLRLDEETRMIAEYRDGLKALENDRTPEGLAQRKALDSALRKAVAVKERKLAEQQKFKTALARITANVAEAEKMFSADGFADEVLAELREMPDLPEDGGDGNGRRRTIEGSVWDDILDALFGDGMNGSEAEDGKEPDLTGEPPTDG